MVTGVFIEEQKPVLDEESNSSGRYKPLELFTYLKRAYVEVQKDKPFFFIETTLKTTLDTQSYLVDETLIDVSFLQVDKRPHKKVMITKFFEECSSQICEPIFAVDLDHVFIYPLPEKKDLDIKISYTKVTRIETNEDPTEENIKDLIFRLPILLEESLRLMFLSFACEKLPDRENRNLSIHYLKRYDKEIIKAKKKMKPRHTNVRSNFQIS